MKIESPGDRDERVRAAVRSHIATLPVPPPDLARIVARAEGVARPRRRSGWVVHAVAAAVAVVVCGTVTAVAVSRGETRYDVAPVFSPGRIPDFASLPGPEVVWPQAVRELPRKLPDDSSYRIADTTDGDDLLVVSSGRETGPLLFNPDSGSIRPVATGAMSDGLAAPRVSTALVAGDRVVWFVSGRRQGRAVREAWIAPLAGGDATKLADLPASAVDGRGVLAGEAVLWEQYGPGDGQDDVVVKRLSLRDGRIADVPGSRGYWLSTVPGWITSQYGGTPFGEPERSGTLVEVATGRKARWLANDEMEATVACGPEWCTGWNVAGDAAIQNLDGSGYVDLGRNGGLSPRLEGRLAIGNLDTANVIWDRGSGRAAVIAAPPPPAREGIDSGDPTVFQLDRDNEAAVYSWRAADGTRMMLDLKRLW
ncbi:hypothetical protein [Phytohabitans houttuyneae]|uniref:Uncharacterized protein n=1 Tax=Phytohabitans houttuyneae TaxID=1076126 RepID=A0A6V8K424_9ACTN|nr:hypothetical protein [Phytohabitans houttuyneae]GFJ77141.1 hypothetical protein Phou_013210 [Phytohabitans houttuyneae]